MTDKEKRAKKRREYFIRAARRIIEKDGVEGLNVRRIAEEAGYAPATIYNYFGNLNGLLSAVIDSYAVDIMQWLNDKLSVDLPPAKKLKTSYLEFARFFLESPDLFKIIFMNENLSAVEDEAMLPNFVEMYQLRMSLFHTLVNEHSYSKDEALRLEGIITSMLFGMLYARSFGISRLEPEKFLQELKSNIEYLIPESRDL
ncbi:hypothetical protein AT15_01785 [Kosmotoga arenicorallina S304]|uniref:HTH tetR-type domain-containing protein n=1 Tax=Kosmotoga arenicorallina S304 TaxID=1453497 RepID=A0A176JZZ8_9BACT|nr:TetR/AcrR family transcriptional regulator [Kosmotoga arenicorallina]OAA29430.1 hypothetical protein AT15_01785 [Kosmotoga arenicorallina S304]